MVVGCWEGDMVDRMEGEGEEERKGEERLRYRVR